MSLPSARISPPTTVDLEAFAAELDALGRELRASISSEDLEHLKKISRWARGLEIFGIATAWIFPNPLTVVAIALGRSSRWTTVAHHILHGAYDRVPEVPARYTRRGFARGGFRYLHWFDWLLPEAWEFEHNALHHGHLGEEADPDQPERNGEWVRNLGVPLSLRYIIGSLIACNWRWLYYAPNVIKAHKSARTREKLYRGYQVWNPLTAGGRDLWLKSLLPYGFLQYVVTPALFAPLGLAAVVSVFCNYLLAEILTNLHTFALVVPSHCGDDVYRFEKPPKDRKEYMWRQVVGSANYHCGGDANDFLHGWLNYQIEHHIWPDLPIRKYQIAQPRVRAICKKYGVEYRQESVIKRLSRCINVLVGRTIMPRY
jgi:fatty acid desaturase